jgi:hypothetical protein
MIASGNGSSQSPAAQIFVPQTWLARITARVERDPSGDRLAGGGEHDCLARDVLHETC